MDLNRPKYNYKLMIFSIIIVVLFGFIYNFYLNDTKLIIRFILEQKTTSFILWTVTVLIFIIHYFKHKSKSVEMEPIITKKFGAFIDSILGGFAYGTTITTSLTLLKGLYIQSFFIDKKYFLEFQNIDLMTIFGVTFFLIYFSVMKVFEIAKETYKIEHTELVLNEKKEIVIQNNNSENE